MSPPHLQNSLRRGHCAGSLKIWFLVLALPVAICEAITKILASLFLTFMFYKVGLHHKASKVSPNPNILFASISLLSVTNGELSEQRLNIILAQ